MAIIINEMNLIIIHNEGRGVNCNKRNSNFILLCKACLGHEPAKFHYVKSPNLVELAH